MNGRYLIINADDFGVCAATNEAIEHLFNEGTVTSTTVMMPCPFANDAVTRAKNNSKITMGLHTTLNAEWDNIRWGAVSPKEKVSSLINSEGHFYQSVSELLQTADAKEVETELEAQYDLLAGMGYKPSHADNHMGSLYGLGGKSFIKEALEFCARHKLPYRFPRRINAVKSALNVESSSELLSMHEQAVGYAGMLGVGLIDDLISNPIPFNKLSGYTELKEIYTNLIKATKEGITEMFLHPSKDDPIVSQTYPAWKARQWEYEFLLSDDLKRIIEKEDIKLVSYKTAPFEPA